MVHSIRPRTAVWLGPLVALVLSTTIAQAESLTLEQQLQRESSGTLAADARKFGDAARGAIVFFQPQMACAKCHAVGPKATTGLGPDLTKPDPAMTDQVLIESILFPSRLIRQGFSSISLTTADGKTLTALLVEQTAEQFVVRELHRGGATTVFPVADVVEWKLDEVSIMPAGQVNLLNSRQQFLDLARYLIEIREGGAVRALQLQPPESLITFKVPEYERDIDHAGIIQSWDAAALKRGEAIYQRVCANCHGTLDRPGSLPTSLKFAEGKFKNGSDPLSMYRTLTSGFGLMAPQTWMVPSQKYDVIHYIRETYIKPHNPTQFVATTADYLQGLPIGTSRGPEPSNIVPWSAMDYGPSLTHTIEVPGGPENLAYKGIALRLDPGPGGVSRGQHWMMFETDTLRMAAGWSGMGNADQNFIDWHGIQFDGAHGVHPRTVGSLRFGNAAGPGWADPTTGSFVDDQRVLGRDGRRYGPLPEAWGQYHGQYHHGQQVVLAYRVGSTEVLELPRLQTQEAPLNEVWLTRTFNVGPRPQDLLLRVADLPTASSPVVPLVKKLPDVIRIGAIEETAASGGSDQRLEFDGRTHVEAAIPEANAWWANDFTIAAHIQTGADGTIAAVCQPGPAWTPDGQAFFIRDGRLAFDIGWVGVVAGRTKVADNVGHLVAVTWDRATQQVQLFVDGKLDGEGRLAPKQPLTKPIFRIGFTAPDFPQPASHFRGQLSEVRVYRQRLSREGLASLAKLPTAESTLQGRWLFRDATGPTVVDQAKTGQPLMVIRGNNHAAQDTGPLYAGVAPHGVAATWKVVDGRLLLQIPKGDVPLRFSVWLSAAPQAGSTVTTAMREARIAEVSSFPEADFDLAPLTSGGPARWPQVLETPVAFGDERGPFAADVLTAPDANPWSALMRFTGLDFFPDGRLAVCTWDGDVWLVTPPPTGLPDPAPAADVPAKLRWQRIATGLFQPLGLKIVQGKIHVICRDQLAVLHDLNNDGEIDFYQCLNNDHQVTEHFHEFAMGLQTDDAGNFYYAKSGCHGKAAVVPQHGTLLKVSADGRRTEILATGFRAANGVCLNPDGSFVVTDQEGFWNPKNRINWVTLNPGGLPKFYGNMLGYHDVTDPSDAAMVAPLCWITNAFDRSPAELLWVKSRRWGALDGSLLNLSYGYGKVFLVLHESTSHGPQGGMIELPIPAFPTGVMRGRFHPQDQQLYLCGMFAWAGNATQPGGLYRLRATGKPIRLPLALSARKTGVKLTFAEPLASDSIGPQNVQVKTWSLKRTANYGSPHYDERTLTVSRTRLSSDGRSLTIELPELTPTWCMELVYSLRSAAGEPVQGSIHNTIHELQD